MGPTEALHDQLEDERRDRARNPTPVFEHSIRNNGGYLSQACSAAEQIAWLYNEELRLGEPTLPMIPKPFGGVPSPTNREYHTGAGYNGPFERNTTACSSLRPITRLSPTPP